MKDNSPAKVFFLDCTVFQNPEIFSHYYEKISEQRKAKIASYSLQEDKRLSLCASVLLKLALEKTGIPEAQQIIKTAKSGKPYLEKQSELFFNLSHSGNIACCVIGPGTNGIDVEFIKPSRIKMTERFFPKEDIDYIFSSETDDEKFFRFFECWTLKEAFCKMKEISLDKTISLPVYDIKKSAFCLTEKISTNYIVSVCTKEKTRISFEELKLTD